MSETIDRPLPSMVELPIETNKTKEERPFNSYVGINEAHRLTGRSKGQIGNDTKSGRLSFQLNERNQKQYQVAELDRVYGLKNLVSENQQRPQTETAETINHSMQIAVLKAQLEMKDEIIQDLREDKERLWQQLQHQLPAPQPAAIVPAAAQPEAGAVPPASKTLWQRIFGA